MVCLISTFFLGNPNASANTDSEGCGGTALVNGEPFPFSKDSAGRLSSHLPERLWILGQSSRRME